MDTPDPTGLTKAMAAELAKKVYTDVVSPAAVQLGQFGGDLAKAFRLVLFPIKMLGQWQDRYAAFLQRIMKEVPPERQVEAPPHVAGPALQALFFIEDENPLQELFLNLLRRCIDKDRQHEAHPGFVRIIEQLSRDEAVILHHVKRLMQSNPILNEPRAYLTFLDDNTDLSKPLPPVPEPMDRTGLQFCLQLGSLAFPLRVWGYLMHLEALSLLHTLGPAWDHHTKSPDGGWCQTYLILTPFGKLFVDACVPDGFPPLSN